MVISSRPVSAPPETSLQRPCGPRRRRRFQHLSIGGGLLFAVTAALLAGCRSEAEIQVYEVPKETTESASFQSAQRMLAAMIRRGDQAWFVKLVGPDGAVTQEIPNFVRLVQSFRFEGESSPPRWELPPGWVDAKKRDNIRFATLEKKTDSGTLEATVTVLPVRGDWNTYVLQNVNRWRGQLGLPLLSQEQLGSATMEMPLASDSSVRAIMVQLRQGGAEQGTGGPAMAGRDGSGPSPASSSAPSGSASSGPSELTFSLPSGWKKAPNDTFSRYAFVVEGEEAAARVTITALRANPSPQYLLANVNRWRAQVDLPPWSLEDLEKGLEDIEFLGGQAKLIVALPEKRAGLQGIIGVIGIHGSTAWFIKMKGDAELLEQKRGQFETFVKSIRIR